MISIADVQGAAKPLGSSKPRALAKILNAGGSLTGFFHVKQLSDIMSSRVES
jgi:hypothetical protein